MQKLTSKCIQYRQTPSGLTFIKKKLFSKVSSVTIKVHIIFRRSVSIFNTNIFLLGFNFLFHFHI